MEIVKVTPDMASKWLKKNSNNRTVSKWLVQNYARQMRENKWQLYGEAIMFDTKGNLMNGQHRLLAVIEADATVPMAVGRGFPESVKDTFDQHRKRKLYTTREAAAGGDGKTAGGGCSCQ